MVTVGRSLPSWSRYQRATTNIQSTYERPPMARCTPEQAVCRRAWTQAARPRHARVRPPVADRRWTRKWTREWAPPGGRCRHAPDARPGGPHPARCAPAHVHAPRRRTPPRRAPLRHAPVPRDLAGAGKWTSERDAPRERGRTPVASAGRAAEPYLARLAARG